MHPTSTKTKASFVFLFAVVCALVFAGCPGPKNPLESQSREALLTARAGFVGFVKQWEERSKDWPAMIADGRAAKLCEESRDLKKLAETNPIESVPALRIEQLKEAISKIDRELDRRGD